MTPETALTDLPDGLRSDLVDAFNEVVRNFREHRWEPSELNGGKLCEAAYCVVLGHLDGTYPARASKPRDMVSACRSLENRQGGPRSFKIQIPRMITALYEVRNNRGVGHAGAEVSPNNMDAAVVLAMSKWILAELVRTLHNLTTVQATDLVEAITERDVPLVWSLGDRKRVLAPGLTWKAKMLLLLLGEKGEVQETELARWLEHPSLPRLRRDVIRPAHEAALIDYQKVPGSVRLLPPGIVEAEALLT